MGPFYSFVFFYNSLYFVITPAILSGMAWLACQFFRYRYDTRLRLFTIPMRICIGLLIAGPFLSYVVFVSGCTSLNDVLSALAFLAVTAVATVFAASGNTKLPGYLQVWTAAIQALILACTLWFGLFPIVAWDAIGAGLQMSGGARQGC